MFNWSMRYMRVVYCMSKEYFVRKCLCYCSFGLCAFQGPHTIPEQWWFPFHILLYASVEILRKNISIRRLLAINHPLLFSGYAGRPLVSLPRVGGAPGFVNWKTLVRYTCLLDVFLYANRALWTMSACSILVLYRRFGQQLQGSWCCVRYRASNGNRPANSIRGYPFGHTENITNAIRWGVWLERRSGFIFAWEEKACLRQATFGKFWISTQTFKLGSKAASGTKGWGQCRRNAAADYNTDAGEYYHSAGDAFTWHAQIEVFYAISTVKFQCIQLRRWNPLICTDDSIHMKESCEITHMFISCDEIYCYQDGRARCPWWSVCRISCHESLCIDDPLCIWETQILSSMRLGHKQLTTDNNAMCRMGC